jgi:hypothetical protein
MKLSDDAKAIVASNLTIAALMVQVVNVLKKKSTTSDGKAEVRYIFSDFLAQLEKGEV